MTPTSVPGPFGLVQKSQNSFLQGNFLVKYAKPLLFSYCYLVAVTLPTACSSNQPAFSFAAPAVSGPAYGNSNAGSLVYVSDGYSKIRMYDFPSLRRSGIIKGQALPGGECADSAGHVFVITRAGISQSSTISEYLAGGKNAVATLSDPGSAFGCAIDPVSGDLAVTNFYDESNPYNTQGDVAVYQDAQGQPSMFYSSVTTNFFWCTYDARSNLYVIAEHSRNEASLIRLSSGSATFEPITLPVPLYEGQGFWPTVQWDGQELAVTSNVKQQGRNGAGPMALY